MCVWTVKELCIFIYCISYTVFDSANILSWNKIRKNGCLRLQEENSFRQQGRVPTAIHSSGHLPNNIPTVINDSLRNMWGSWKSPPHISLLLWARHLTSLLPFLHLWTSITTVSQDNYKGRFVIFFAKCFEHEKLKMNCLMYFFFPLLLRTPSKSHHEREIALVINSTPALCAAKEATQRHRASSTALLMAFAQSCSYPLVPSPLGQHVMSRPLPGNDQVPYDNREH